MSTREAVTSAARRARPERFERPRGELRLTIGLWLALVAVIVPLPRVLAGGAWLFGALALAALLLGVGFALRRWRVPAIGVTLAELAVWIGAVTAAFLPGSAVFWFIPTGGSIEAVTRFVQTAATEITVGIAPLEPTRAVSFLVVAALGLLTIGLDHVVLTARMPLLASAALVIVWLIPAIAVPSGVDLFAFVLLAVAILSLIRAETRTREGHVSATSAGGVTAVATAIGAIAIIGALLTVPALPPPTIAAAGSGRSATINASLDLGNDLRQRSDVAVLTMRSNAPQLPNLRVATLSVFEGSVWAPDRSRSVSLADEGLEPVVAAEGIRVVEYRTHVDITRLSSSYLPVPYPAVEIAGLDGNWRTVPYSRTVLTGQGNVQGQSYEVVSHVPRPTLEQIRAADASAQDSRVDVSSLPEGTPTIIAEEAARVTAAATTDYDKLIALQDWLRGPEFTYSLAAPVEAGFDDAGVDAVAAFLREKEGYCIHFASAFALMARSLGLPTRIVVGFLPGDYTGDTIDGQRVAEVTTSQLHAWPEVSFDGIGWVPFEPTKGLGTPTRFASGDTGAGNAGDDVTVETAAPTPTATSSAAAGQRPDDREGRPSGTTARVVDPRPALAMVGLVLLLAVAPAAAGWARRRLLRRRGTVSAAWCLVQDAAIDLGVAVSAAESPRAFGARLVAAAGAPPAAVAALVRAVELASYARDGEADAAPGRSRNTAFAAAERIRRDMLATATSRDRAIAVGLPRSLVIRPGSPFADRAARA